jgi:hypothetical protein
LHAGELRSFLQIAETGQRIEQKADAWAQENALNWFDDGLSYVLTGGSRRTPFGPYVPGLPDDVNFVDEPNGAWASILIEKDSFSDWYYSAAGPMAGVEAREKDKGGRPADYDWDSIKAYALALVQEHGRPGKGNRRLSSKDELTGAIMNEWASKDIELAKSTVSRYVRKWLSEI